jgi:plastocyanin
VKESNDGYGSASFSFDPSNVTITRGGTVTWSTEGGSGVVHNVTFSPASGVPTNVANFSSGNNSRTFNTSGSFGYACTNHPGMSGQVTVQ